jgi:hypothetical protein
LQHGGVAGANYDRPTLETYLKAWEGLEIR